MKRVIIAIYTFCLSFSVFAQQNFSGMFQANELEWVQSYREKGSLLGETFSEVCVMAGRSIFPVPEHGVERHILAGTDSLGVAPYLVKKRKTTIRSVKCLNTSIVFLLLLILLTVRKPEALPAEKQGRK